ncbi:MAG: site-2 protease family protein [Campylobacteraceae bacterium]|nr:site-2 protease family protein [Campylobacteraceae bacterium]
MFKNIGLIAFIFKISPILLKFFKSAKIIKLALAGGSMLAYSYLFTWEFAAILLGAIVFHEYGHITAMKKCGIKTKGIYLIPFLGGAAVPSRSFRSRTEEVYVSLMGPWYGLILLLPFLVYGVIFESSLAIGLASFMALLNLFNLVPISPLDGGRVLKSIAFSLNSNLGIGILSLGLAGAGYLVYLFEIWVLLIVIIIGSIELFFEIKNKNKLIVDVNYNMNAKDILSYTTVYIVTVLIFIGVIYFTADYPGADLALKLIKDDM